jgi:S-adenosylmethionine hydrolase
MPSETTEPRWDPSGIVTLTTDFDTRDPYVGMMKGVLLRAHRGVRIVDLCHGVPPQEIRVAAWMLEHSIRYFPAGTVHVAVVDPGVGSSRGLLVAEDQGAAFLAPDNGLLPAALSRDARYHELDLERFALPDASRTFHGRDVLAPAAAAIAAGLAPAAAGRVLARPPVGGRSIAPRRIDDAALEAEVLLADRYGNLVLAVRPADLGGDLDRWRVEIDASRVAGATPTETSLAIRGTYADVAPGVPLALVDSYGAIEIAVRDGSARERFGLEPGARVVLRRQG